jgi:hypothetical protein
LYCTHRWGIVGHIQRPFPKIVDAIHQGIEFFSADIEVRFWGAVATELVDREVSR